MPSSYERYASQRKLLSAAARWMSSNHYFEASNPGANDDTEMEMNDEQLLDAAREFVRRHHGVETVLGGTGQQIHVHPDVDATNDMYQVVVGTEDTRDLFLNFIQDNNLMLEAWAEPIDHDDIPTMFLRSPSDPPQE